MDSTAATENLRLIRRLMERATVYRAVSGPTAFVAGLLAAGLAVRSWLVAPAKGFFPAWIAMLALVALFNTMLLWRSARLRGEPLFTPAFRMAMRSLLPPLGTVFLFSWIWWENGGDDHWTACLWAAGYGLGLLSTHSFAPPSMIRLGGAFLLAGLGFALARHWGAPVLPAWAVMGLTFGLFHLAYAACVPWRIRAAAQEFTTSREA